MPQLSSRQASIYAALVFLTTILLSLTMHGNTITLSGLLIVIFLSVFVSTRSSTVIAGIVSCIVVIGFMSWYLMSAPVKDEWPAFLFILILCVFSTLIVLYIKTLIRNMQFDKSHMTSLFENATEGIIVANSDADIILVNPAASKMFHYEATELIGKKVEVLLPRKQRSGHVSLRNGFYKDPHNRVMGSGRDLYGERKDGDNFPVEVSLSSYEQNNNKYVIAFIIDITQRKEIEQNMLQQQKQLETVSADIRKLNTELEAKVEERTIVLREALQRLEQSQSELSDALDKERQLNEIKSRFLSMASHEFRTPLSAVLSSASLISKYTLSDQQDNRNKHINRIKDSVKHLNDLLEDFLSLGKLDEGKVGASFSTFDLPDAVQETIDDMKGIVKENQEILYSHSGQHYINSDRKLLKNILINLISNAVKFSEAGEKIVINSTLKDKLVTVFVTDNGIGISKEDQEHLFSTFFRGKNAVNVQGTGLGLHIVKRYVDLMGGTINFQSQLGKGTTISIQFPVNNNEINEENIGN